MAAERAQRRANENKDSWEESCAQCKRTKSEISLSCIFSISHNYTLGFVMAGGTRT